MIKFVEKFAMEILSSLPYVLVQTVSVSLYNILAMYELFYANAMAACE